jgi:hypothetical protein
MLAFETDGSDAVTHAEPFGVDVPFLRHGLAVTVDHLHHAELAEQRSASCSVIAPPVCSASTMVTARR